MKIALIGRFEEGEIVAGPERVGRELFYQLNKINPENIFIEYFFSGYKDSSVLKKLFGKKPINDGSVVRLGVFPLILFLMKEKFDIIHIVNLQRFILLLFLFKPFIRSKITATLHGYLGYEIPRKNIFIKRYFIDLWVEKLIIKKCDLCIFPSQLLFGTFNSHYKISGERYQIIPNGVSEIFKSRNKIFPKIENQIRIIFYNGFNENINKGLPEIIALLQDVNRKIELFVIGKKANAKSSGNLKINYLGLITHEEIISLVREKHFVIKSPAFEPFSIFIAECMMLGLIPIINQNVGIKDFIVDGFNGFYYKTSSRIDLQNLFDNIIEGYYDLEMVSSNAQRIYELLDWQKISQTYYKTFNGEIN